MSAGRGTNMNWKWLLQATSSSSLKTKLSLIRESLPKLGKADDTIRCMVCPNMCLHACPVFDVERRLTVSPSIKSRLAFLAPSEAGDNLWRCVPCDACRESCPMNISVNENLRRERELLCGGNTEPEAVKKAFVSHEMRIKEIKKNFDYGEREGKLLYFPGCKTLEVPEIVRATVKILNHLRLDYALKKDILCCGAYLRELGYLSQYREHIAAMKDLKGYEGVISNCPHCVQVLQEDYGIRAVHISKVIADSLPSFNFERVSGRVVYHDPCILSRKLGIYDEPRTILRKFGFEISEPVHSKRNTYCCGFGGVYPYIDISSATLMAEKRKNELAEQSHTILTFCPSCRRALSAKDVTELIAEWLG
jgi:Fe-S oxidoreductase